MGGISQNQAGNILVEELCGLSNKDQADVIAEHYASVSNEYKPLQSEDIPHRLYQTGEKPPKVEPYQVFFKIQKMSLRKANVKG